MIKIIIGVIIICVLAVVLGGVIMAVVGYGEDR